MVGTEGILGGVLGILLIIAIIVWVLAWILLPIYIISINNKIGKMLEIMEVKWK